MRASYHFLRRSPVVGVLAIVMFATARCSSTPTTPSQQPPAMQPPLQQPPATNAPPTITSLTSSGPRVEADEEVQLTASVQDAETPIDQLVYDWSAKPVNGVFNGNGRVVRWRAPHLQPTPDLYTITLNVTENFTANGQPQQNKAASTVQVHYNDSYREIATIGRRFLTSLFPDYSVSPDQAVQDFTDSCPGKAAEREDVANNRANFHILSGTYAISSLDLNADKTFGSVSGTCVFHDIPTATGKEEIVTGICSLTAVYENWQWYLCDSHFAGTSVSTTSLRFMKP